jgi:hypothetical protein
MPCRRVAQFPRFRVEVNICRRYELTIGCGGPLQVRSEFHLTVDP